MTTRPLVQKGIGALEQMFAESAGDTEVVRSLQDELKHRQVPRAIALLQKVEKALKSGKVPEADTEPETMSPERVKLTELLRRHRSIAAQKQPMLWPESNDVAPAGSATSASAAPAPPAPSVSSQVGKGHAATHPADKAPFKAEPLSMSVSEAYQRLQSAPGRSWEVFEEARRRIVQQSHPENLVDASEKKRIELVTEAKSANLAYEIIRKERILNFL